MATNPMQKKTRNAFILGVLLMLVVTALIVALLYMKIQNQDKELAKYKQTTSVYVLNQDVKSGQVLTGDMFTEQKIANDAIPSNATQDVYSMLENAKIIDTQGRAINPPTSTKNYYYYSFAGQEGDAIIYDVTTNQPAASLQAGDKAYYKDSNNQNVNIEIAKVSTVIAKIDMKAKTVITRDAITPADERSTDDLRKVEYNIISLPVDLSPDEYVDIRLRMPTGQDYIVVSKKKVSIPIVNGEYLADTIQMNLTEEEILMMSGAILENFKVEGSELHATRYTEAGIQSAATMTYYPNSEVQKLLEKDPNVVRKAINGIISSRNEVRQGLDSAVSKFGDDEKVTEKVESSVTSSQEARKNYLQTLTGGAVE